jgi:branched-chain amino acid transport system ATP-binding protein
MDSPILQAVGITINFGGVTALDHVNVEVSEGERLAIIGSNGAGKTTLFNVLTGFEPLQQGSVLFRGQTLSKHSLDSAARLGIVRTFQNVRLLPKLTVFENLKVAALSKDRKANDKRIMHELDRLDLADRADMPARELPYGLQKRLELLRAMLLDPQVLLVDEPVAGLNPTESATVIAAMDRFVAERGTSLVIIEHDMQSVRAIADRLIVLNYGRIIATGAPAEVLANQLVIDSYLGGL